jgi:hypothetical protein
LSRRIAREADFSTGWRPGETPGPISARPRIVSLGVVCDDYSVIQTLKIIQCQATSVYMSSLICGSLLGAAMVVLIGLGGYLTRHSLQRIHARRKFQIARSRVRRDYWGYE